MSGGEEDDEEEKTHNNSDNESPKKRKKTTELKAEREFAIDEDSNVDVVAYDSFEEANSQWSLRESSSPVESVTTSVPAYPPSSVSSGVPASR